MDDYEITQHDRQFLDALRDLAEKHGYDIDPGKFRLLTAFSISFVLRNTPDYD